jgi:hypothetical protein
VEPLGEAAPPLLAGFEPNGLADLATGQVEIERIALRVGLGVDFRREAATRAAVLSKYGKVAPRGAPYPDRLACRR